MFFTCKNTLICSLLLYRVIVVQIERRRQTVQRFRHWASLYHASRGGSDAASSSVVRLVTMAKSASSIASSATAVLRRSQSAVQQQPLPAAESSERNLNYECTSPSVRQTSNNEETEKISTLSTLPKDRSQLPSVEHRHVEADENLPAIRYVIKRHYNSER
jgi:hypothetical protein